MNISREATRVDLQRKLQMIKKKGNPEVNQNNCFIMVINTLKFTRLKISYGKSTIYINFKCKFWLTTRTNGEIL